MLIFIRTANGDSWLLSKRGLAEGQPSVIARNRHSFRGSRVPHGGAPFIKIQSHWKVNPSIKVNFPHARYFGSVRGAKLIT